VFPAILQMDTPPDVATKVAADRVASHIAGSSHPKGAPVADLGGGFQ
jgi:hypothetical protein